MSFALEGRIKDELQKLIEQDVLESVHSRTWVTAIVPIVKENGSIRISGDYKPTPHLILIVDANMSSDKDK